MIKKRSKPLVLIGSIVILLGLFSYAIWRIASAKISADTLGFEICDNRVDDNRDGQIDGCWDPGNNYQPTGRIYFVSKAGNASDSNSGTESSPFKTINKATALVQPGEAVYVLPGIYQENVEFTNRGEPDRPILFKGIGSKGSIIIQKRDDETGTDFRGIRPRSNTIIDNFKTDGVYTYDPTTEKHSLGGYGIQLSNVENILIKDCIMQQSEKGIRAEEGNRLIVRNSKIQQCEWGTQIGTDNKNGPSPEFKNTLWENVEVYDSPYEAAYNTDGFLVEGDTAYHVFRNCTAHGFHDGGFDIKAHALIENCKAYDNSWPRGENGSGFKIWRDTTVRNSISYNNKVNNYLFGGLIANWKMVGNVSYNGHISFEKRTASDPNLSPSTITLSHNIFLDSTFNDEIGGAFSKGDHNLFYGDETPSTKGNYALVTDPKFVNASGKDFRLQIGSPAIDAGAASVLPFMSTTDIAGNNRKSGPAIDIGAYEFGSSNVSVTPSVNPSPAISTIRSAVASVTSSKTPTINSGTNKPPTINPITPKSVLAGNLLSFNISAIDPESNPVKYRINLPDGTIKYGKAFSWRPNINQTGNFVATVRAIDSLGAYSDKKIDIVVFKNASFSENRTLNVTNAPGQAVTFQVCRRAIYSSTRFKEKVIFGDGSPALIINESAKSACSSNYSHSYQPGSYMMSLFLCSKDSSGQYTVCFPHRTKLIKM